VRRFNIFAPEFDHESDRDGYRWRGAVAGRAIGAEKIGGCIYELGDGQKTYPFHFHHGMEEWLIVLTGEPTLRGADGEQSLRAGDVVCFPPGPDGAHQVRGPGTIFMLSANRMPESVEYLDSAKIGIRPPGKVFRAADAADYWEGEA
jgi:uncharacterized cupin superfamily protein